MNFPSVLSGFSLASLARGTFFRISSSAPILLVVLVVIPAVAQEAIVQTGIDDTEVVETTASGVVITESGRGAWDLSETDWSTYTKLMRGPSGLWYSRLDPAFVLGINAKSESERERFARIVYDQERQRLDDLFAFNRAYQRIARAERSTPGFSYFGEFGDINDLSGSSIPDPFPARVLIFVGPDCPRCDRSVLDLVVAGRSFDIYYVGAGSNAEISRWARRIGLPPSRVRDRSITLNHDRGTLARTDMNRSDLPVLFHDSSLTTSVSLKSVIRGGPGE
ncbi:MAG: TIGR03759 family integrating conjugative element protein [Gammaproteobacteria bacterium]|nr:TIGR03759 family integrating conjugative element protein [Gammaproteobacteria bacterium]MYG68413.1 TIGR03759 family integrating conjugative element protein [Gammaproteobacteria bacterium]